MSERTEALLRLFAVIGIVIGSAVVLVFCWWTLLVVHWTDGGSIVWSGPMPDWTVMGHILRTLGWLPTGFQLIACVILIVAMLVGGAGYGIVYGIISAWEYIGWPTHRQKITRHIEADNVDADYMRAKKELDEYLATDEYEEIVGVKE